MHIRRPRLSVAILLAAPWLLAVVVSACTSGGGGSSKGGAASGAQPNGANASANPATSPVPSTASTTPAPCSASSGSNLQLLALPGYSGVQSLVNADCASSSCHASGATAPDLSSQAGASDPSTAAQCAAEIQSGKMPPNASSLSAADKTQLLAFFSGSGGSGASSASPADGSSGSASPAASSQPSNQPSGQWGSPSGQSTASHTAAPCAPSNTYQPAATTPSTASVPGGGGNGSGGSSVPGASLESCSAQGLAWVLTNGTGSCGDALAKFCCTEADVYSEFPDVKSQLQPLFDKNTQSGLKLYACSVTGTRYTFHFAGTVGSSVSYQGTWIDGATPSGNQATQGQCPQITSADLGLPGSGGGGATVGSTSPTDSGSSTGATASGGTLPSSIGTLVSTASADLLAQLTEEQAQSRGYTQWTASAMHTSAAHGNRPVKTFWNAKLTASLAANNTQHPIGSIAIKEIYQTDGKTLDGWAVLAKAADGAVASSWMTYEIFGSPNFNNPPTSYGLGDQACATCHNTGKDFIKSHP